MPEHCTCGATLVENARFCHRCGRPTFEPEPTPPPIPEQVAEPLGSALQEVRRAQSAVAQLPVGFGNPIALRVAGAMSICLMLLQMIPFMGLLFAVWWPAAGWGGVLLYRKLTGLTLSIRAGARLGTLTGILTFVGMAIVFSMSMAFMGKQVLEQMVQQDPRMSEVVNNPPMLAAVFLMVLALVFAMVVGLCAAGGALGAKFNAPKASTQA